MNDDKINGHKRHNDLLFTSTKLTILPKITIKQDVFYQSNPILFIHSSKTGGTNVDYLLKSISYLKGFESLYLFCRCDGISNYNTITNGCIGGLEKIKSKPSSYDLTKKDKVSFITGHMPLPTKDYFKKEVSYISVVRNPLDRLISLGNFYISKKFY